MVVSCVNLVHGGTLSVARDCLKNLVDGGYDQTYRILFLVHDKTLFQDLGGNVGFLEYPDIKASWLKRIRFEYRDCKKLSRELHADFWLALHDMTPAVCCKQAVYCHCPTPFFKVRRQQIRYDKKVWLFSLFYKFLYRIHIRRNTFVIVQQQWIREKFQEFYGISNVLVAHPTIETQQNTSRKQEPCLFIFPTVARFFKNIEVIGEAAKRLEAKGIHNFEVVLTVSKDENLYGNDMVERYGTVQNVRFIGYIPREELIDLYARATAMIFPSKLETWGMPITEFESFHKPVIVADLPYAHETVGSYDQAVFFDPDDAGALGDIMEKAIQGEPYCGPVTAPKPPEPFCQGWQELLRKITEEMEAC